MQKVLKSTLFCDSRPQHVEFDIVLVTTLPVLFDEYTCVLYRCVFVDVVPCVFMMFRFSNFFYHQIHGLMLTVVDDGGGSFYILTVTVKPSSPISSSEKISTSSNDFENADFSLLASSSVFTSTSKKDVVTVTLPSTFAIFNVLLTAAVMFSRISIVFPFCYTQR